MKKLFSIAAAAALVLGMASCAKEGGSNATTDGSGLLKIVLENSTKDLSRAPIGSDPAESFISGIEVWIFNAGGETRPTPAEGQTNYFTMTTLTGTASVPAGNMDVLVLVNAGLGNEGANATASMEELMNMASTKTFTKANNGTRPDGGFAMAGQTLGVAIAESGTVVRVGIDRNVSKVTPPTFSTDGTIDLTEEEWKEIFPDAPEGTFTNPAEINADASFTISGFAVLNGLPKSSVGFSYVDRSETSEGAGDWQYRYNPGHAYRLETNFNYGNPWVRWSINTYTHTGTGRETVFTQTTVGATEAAMGPRLMSDGQAMWDENITVVNDANLLRWAPYSGWYKVPFSDSPAIYVHESRAGQTVDSGTGSRGYHYNQIVSYIVGGKFVVEGINTPATAVERFWRIDMRTQEAFHILRNSLYSLAISKITTPGFETPWEAETENPVVPEPGEKPTDFVLSVNPWQSLPVGNAEM